MRFCTYCIFQQQRILASLCKACAARTHKRGILEPKVPATFMLLAPLDSCAGMFKGLFYAYAIRTKII